MFHTKKHLFEYLILIVIISETYTLINWLKINSLMDYTQGDLSIMFSVHVPLAIIVSFSIMPLTIAFILNHSLNLNKKKIRTIAYLLMTLSMITLISGIIWGQPVWGNIYILDKKILDIIFITLFYAIITFSKKLNIIPIICLGTLYYFIKISLPNDVSSLHQNISNRSTFYNSIPAAYSDMILNNITVIIALTTLYIITS